MTRMVSWEGTGRKRLNSSKRGIKKSKEKTALHQFKDANIITP